MTCLSNERAREWRLKLGLTVAQLAKIGQLSPLSIKAFERAGVWGTNNPIREEWRELLLAALQKADMRHTGARWQRVVFADQVGDDDRCPSCGGDYTACECPGPSMDEKDYEYTKIGEVVLARKRR